MTSAQQTAVSGRSFLRRTGWVRSGQARAYCGPAHGRCWTVDVDGPPADLVELRTGDHPARYRLVRQPRSRLPARDFLGNYLYVPVRHELGAGP